SFAGWDLNRTYNFRCRYTSTNVTIWIDGTEIVNVEDCFHPGRFGFYNASQDNVTYADFSYQVASDFSIEHDSICLGDTARYSIFCDPSFQSPYASTSWDMGDGTTYNHPNEVEHIYTSPGVYNVSLEVEDVNGCTDQIIKTITVFDTLVGIGPDITHCENEINSQTLDATINAQDTYLWSTGETTPIITVNQTGIYDVITTNVVGCIAKDTVEVTFNPKPIADFSVNDTCFGDPNQFVDQSLSNGSSIDSWDWYFDNDMIVDDNTQNPSHTFPAMGTQNVGLIVSNNFNCYDTLYNNLEIFELPVANFTAAPVCLNDQIQFINSSSIGTGSITNWDWAFDDGGVSVLENPTHIYTSEGVYNVDLTVTSNHGCVDSYTSNATVFPLPQVDFSASTVCEYEITSFIDETTLSNAHTNNSITNWNWDFGDGNTSTQQNPQNNYVSANTFNVILEVTTNNNCVNTYNESVTVIAQPQADFLYNDTCYNEPVSFENTSVPNTGSIINQRWYFDADPIPDALSNNPTFVFPTVGTQNVVLIVENDAGCLDTVNQAVEVYDLPIASFNVNESCLNDNSIFNNLSSIPTGTIDTYLWNFGDGNASTLENPTHTYGSE
ncbi:hypothetical protein CW751_15025, partial [Brumimicrobium salinarum]